MDEAMAEEGWIRGRPVSLTVLDYGLFRVHSNGRVIGIVGFLIRTDRGENILVDTGFPPSYAEDAAGASAADGLGSFGEVLELTQRNLPDHQLRLAGVEPDGVDLLILTHSHIDHVGGIAGFAQAPILVAAADRAEARPLYFGKVRPMVWPDRRYILVTGDVQLGPGLQVLLVPGHVPGQLALRVDLPETGAVIVTGDAISRPAEIDERFDTAHDPVAAQASAARLMALAGELGAFVIYGHAPDQWPELKKAPHSYG
jgi:N-acyl homoserine lactone hydrolase